MGYKNYRLTVIKGFNKGKVFRLEQDKITIGRGEDNTIVLNIAEVSRAHSALTKVEEGYMIRDLGSTNGTFVDKKEIGEKYLLKPGDTVMFGDAVYMTYMAEPDPEVTQITPRTKEPEAEQVTAVTPRVDDPPVEEIPPVVKPEEDKTTQDILSESQGEEKKSNTWLWAGIGCIVVIFFLIVVGAIIFDFLDLYCTPPFDTLMRTFWACP